MKEVIGGRMYNTETSTLVKYCVVEEELGNGYTRYSTRAVYSKSRSDEYFLYVRQVTTDRQAYVIDICEWIVPVSDEWASKFRRGTELLYPAE